MRVFATPTSIASPKEQIIIDLQKNYLTTHMSSRGNQPLPKQTGIIPGLPRWTC
jgi:hypothetical protein